VVEHCRYHRWSLWELCRKQADGGTVGVPVFGSGYGLSIPEGHNPLGLEVGFWAYYASAAGGVGHLSVSLANNGALIGTSKPQALTTMPTFYSLGNGTDKGGENLNLLRGLIQSSTFGAGITPSATGTSGAEVDIYISTLPITLFTI